VAEAAPLQPDPNWRETDRPLLRLVGALRGGGAPDDRPDGGDDRSYRQILDALGVAMYTTDAAGRITFFNDAAVELWGRRPALGEEWCGSWRLFWPDGRPMRHDECPMAIALRENRAVRGWWAIA
jgi:PAS domain-containing protein